MICKKAVIELYISSSTHNTATVL